jgi:hypothetical protein
MRGHLGFFDGKGDSATGKGTRKGDIPVFPDTEKGTRKGDIPVFAKRGVCLSPPFSAEGRAARVRGISGAARRVLGSLRGDSRDPIGHPAQVVL